MVAPRRVDNLQSLTTMQSMIAILGDTMASITIRNLDDETKERLRVRAAKRRRSMEDEARNILRETLARDSVSPVNLAEAIARRFKPVGGVDLELPLRDEMRAPPEFGS